MDGRVSHVEVFRCRLWDLAASDNGVQYIGFGEQVAIHDPAIMPPGTWLFIDLDRAVPLYYDMRQ